MRIPTILVSAVLFVAGCDVRGEALLDVDGGTPCGEMSCPGRPDLTTPPPACPAAKGLLGDPLLCVDFSQVADLMDQKVKDWIFTAAGPNCWEIVGGVLQVKNFTSFMGICGLALKAINLADAKNANYKSLTLSLRQHVDVDPVRQQQAEIFMGVAVRTQQLNSTTDTNLPQQLVIITDKTDLPTMPSGGYKYLLYLNAPLTSVRQGWQISSIAVMGNP